MVVNATSYHHFSCYQQIHLEELKEKIDQLNSIEHESLKSKVYQLALKDGIIIEPWDYDWGQYHLFDDTARLITAFIEQKKEMLFGSQFPASITQLVVTHCPLMIDYLFPERNYRCSLKEKVNCLGFIERDKLESRVYQLALKEGLEIASWDCEWGKNHLFDDNTRLIKALDDQNILLENGLRGCTASSDKEAEDLILRANYLWKLNSLKGQLNEKYSDLRLESFEETDIRSKAWKAMEIFLLTFPVKFTEVETQRFEHFERLVEECIKGRYDKEAVASFLDCWLAREAPHPMVSDLHQNSCIQEVARLVRTQVHRRTLQKSTDSLWKDVMVIPSSQDKRGKLKLLGKQEVIKEVFASHCDRMLGFNMTLITQPFGFGNFFQPLIESKELFRKASFQKDLVRAELLRRKAFQCFEDPKIPLDVRNCIFSETYFLRGDNQKIKDLGEKLFYSHEGYSCTDLEKAVSIQNYFDSGIFKNHVTNFSYTGSMQLWKNNCLRAYDFIVRDENGGSKLKTASKTLVHFYALLGMIKGSMDCSSGNSFVEFDPVANKVINFWDFDDERSMPTVNNYRKMRMWQMGLPQCSQPFDRAFLLLFSDPRLLQKLKKQQTSPQISPNAYQRQMERLERIISIFNGELSQEELTLTPRDLYFSLFGGRQEFDGMKFAFNSNKTYSSEGIRVSPIELFEFHLSGTVTESCYTRNEYEKKLVSKNMRDLYSSELP